MKRRHRSYTDRQRERARQIMAWIDDGMTLRRLIGKTKLSTRQLQRYAARAGAKLNYGPGQR